MIAETLAGIALVKAAVDGIKSAIGTANDIGDIASQIDSLFEGEKQVQQKRANKSGVALGDQFGINHVAQEMLDARIAQEKMYEISQMVDLRFGPGTWRGIVDERAKRIQEAKEAMAVAKRAARKKHNEMINDIKMFATVVATIAVGGIALVWAISSSL